MSTAGEDRKVERERTLGNAIIRQVEHFQERYEQISPRAAWWRLTAELVLAGRAWEYGQPAAQLPRPAASREASGAGAMTQELDGKELEEKRRRWRRLWAKVEGLIVALEAEHQNAKAEDSAWCQRVAVHMRHLADWLHTIMVDRHPGMPRVDDIDAGEIVGALFDLDIDDDEPDDDLEPRRN